VADQTRTSTIEELRRAVQDKERELSELDLMLADYHTEHFALIRELRRLQAQLRDAEDAVSSLSEP
jgi:ribosomal protein L29